MEIAVSDSGRESPRAARLIFELFHRGDAARRLGLAIAKLRRGSRGRIGVGPAREAGLALC